MYTSPDELTPYNLSLPTPAVWDPGLVGWNNNLLPHFPKFIYSHYSHVFVRLLMARMILSGI